MKAALEAFARSFAPPIQSDGGLVALPSLTGSADAFLAVTLAGGAELPRLVLAVTPGIPDADRLADDLGVLTSSPDCPPAFATRVLEFPPLLDGDRSALGTRLKTVAAVKAWALNPYPCVVVAPFPALVSPVPRGNVSAIELTTALKFSELSAKLAEIGYNRVPQVNEIGDYSVRGGIIDAWSPGEEFPVRAEFFDEDLESIRKFDPATQISIARVNSSELLPVEVRDRSEELRDKSEEVRDEKTFTLLDLVPKGSAVLAIEHNEYNLPSSRALDSYLSSRNSILVTTGLPAPAKVATYDFTTTPLPGFAELGAEEAHHPELFDAARRRLDQHVAAATKRGAVIARLDTLSGGFELPAAEDGRGLLVVTKSDRVFAKRKTSVRHTGNGAGARVSSVDDLEPGEYVVHIDHGVGRYLGSSEILVDGRRSEVFTVEYADGAKLHVPAAHAHLLSRYVGVKGETVKLHRLDGKRWAKDKSDAQKAVADLAVALLETQARRETVPGFAYDVHCDGRAAFDAAFPYEETPDQAAAIAAIEKDLAAAKPMDRLICGDAGYGKTEVAMRAAFIAAMNGKQVAVLAPTTVLAEQHFETFTSRFDGTPVRIESMSRFQSAAVHSGTFRRLATGVCDIVIGTHAILSAKTVFHDLGLIIIDEEQRFGVRHKEFLKALRATADVLTLSATPIPRTLYLSMTGARDLSLLRSPPRERVAVDTKIVTDSDEVVRSAVEAELARGGQVFFLHNRVHDIGKIEKRLKEIVPAARVVTAHGQMDSAVLARKMRDFERGEYDILLSTTIVESGIDIPRANTILVDQAHTFGLADLYQLRGRVGRSSRQGHAVFLLPSAGLIDSDARERLNALKRHGGLGSGFNLAVRDLELRGAGNLLGAQQSGHIAAVGFGLYCQLLQRTIAALKGEKLKEVVDVRLNLDFIDLSPASEDSDSAAVLPYAYVEEDAQRLSFLRRFAEANDERVVKALAEELEDRFGPLPAAAKRMVRLAALRIRCARAGVGIVDAKETRAVLYRNGTREVFKVVDLRRRNADGKISELMAQV